MSSQPCLSIANQLKTIEYFTMEIYSIVILFDVFSIQLSESWTSYTFHNHTRISTFRRRYVKVRS